MLTRILQKKMHLERLDSSFVEVTAEPHYFSLDAHSRPMAVWETKALVEGKARTHIEGREKPNSHKAKVNVQDV